MLTAEHLRELLHYDPSTGVFTWRVSRGRLAKLGQVAGSLDHKGYVRIRTGDRKKYRAHRLAWLYMTGEWPTHQIDHRNLSKADNRWLNLRAVSHGQNRANAKLNMNNTSGYKGVYLFKRGGDHPWYAQINANGRRVYLGSFATPEEANAARLDAAKELHGEFARAA